MSEQGLYDLPEGWQWVRLGDVTKIIGGGTPKTDIDEYFNNGTIPWITPKDLSKYVEIYISKGERNISDSGLKNSSAKLLPENTVILSSRAPIGYVAIASNDLTTNQGFKSFLPNENYNPKYLYWYLKNSKDLIESYASGTTFLEISASKAGLIQMPLPPLETQQQIVNNIETLCSKITQAKELLEEARDSFEKRRIAILHKAFTGELTKEWRKENWDIIKNENEFADIEEVPESERPYELPEGWKWVKFNEAIKIKSGKNLTKKNMDTAGDIAVYGGNGITGYHSKYNVSKDKIIIGRVGFYCGSVHLTESEAWVTDNAFIIDFDEKEFDVIFLMRILKYLDLGKNSNSTAQPVISGKTLQEVYISKPPKKEQQKIVSILETLLNKEQEAKTLLDLEDSIKLLEKSILSKAFRGELCNKT